MPAPSERLIRKLSRMQELGEKVVFLLPAGRAAERAEAVPRERPAPSQTPARREGVVPPKTPVPRESALRPELEVVSDRDPLERRWADLERQVRACRSCRLCESRTQAVFGSGTRRTRLFVVGEGPGEQEDRRGEAFVGRAGELLTRILQAIDFRRDQVFITNVVKCRPPGNRAPLPDEVAACSGYLQAQLEIVQPAVILALGTTAARALLATSIPISRLRGRVHLHQGIPLIATYHPAALLRNPEYKRPTWEDVQLLRRVYDERVAELAPGSEEP